MNNRKNILLTVFLIIGLGLFVYLIWAIIMNRVEKNKEAEDVVCAADAMQCPDGSWVGRSGPDCEFVCPTGTSTGSTDREISLQAAVGQTISGLDVQITPIEIVEDSRCPSDVQCIQAGTVRVRTLISSGLGTSTMVLTLAQPITTEAEAVTLVAVAPTPLSSKTISAKDYRFTFKVNKR